MVSDDSTSRVMVFPVKLNVSKITDPGPSGDSRFDEDLHTSSQPQNKVQSRLLLDVVVRQRSAILELFTGKDQTLLVRRDTLLVLDLGLDVVDSIRRFDLKSDRLSRERLDENLHSSSETEDQVQGGFLLDVWLVRRGDSTLIQIYSL